MISSEASIITPDRTAQRAELWGSVLKFCTELINLRQHFQDLVLLVTNTHNCVHVCLVLLHLDIFTEN